MLMICDTIRSELYAPCRPQQTGWKGNPYDTHTVLKSSFDECWKGHRTWDHFPVMSGGQESSNQEYLPCHCYFDIKAMMQYTGPRNGAIASRRILEGQESLSIPVGEAACSSGLDSGFVSMSPEDCSAFLVSATSSYSTKGIRIKTKQIRKILRPFVP